MKVTRGFLGGCAVGAVGAWVLPFGVILLGTLVAPDWFAGLRAGQLPPPPVWGQEAAGLDWAVEDLSGAEATLARYGGAVVVLHFWRPGCLACRAELPGLNGLHAALAGTGAAVVGVALADFEEAAALAASGAVAFPLYLRRDLPPAPFAVTATPATYILGPDGAIAFRHQGAARWDAPEVVAFVAALGQTGGVG